MESTHMELSFGDITCKVCRSFKWNFWQWKLQKHLVPDLFVGQQLNIYQIEEQSLLSLLVQNWVNPWNLHLLLHDFPNHVYSDLLWKLNHGSAEPGLPGHRRIKVLFFTPTHTQSRHTRMKMKDQSLFRDVWFLLKRCGSAVTTCGKIVIFYCAAIFPAAVGRGCR